MNVYYLSDGEQSGLMDFDDLIKNLTENLGETYEELGGFSNAHELLADISGAIDWPFAQGFWHGTIGMYNVCIIAEDFINDMKEDN